jgi:hypothetical protein
MQQELTLLLRTLYEDRGARAVVQDLGRVQEALRASEQAAAQTSSSLQALLAGGVGGVVGAGLIAALGTVQNLLSSIVGLSENFLRGIVQASMQMEQMKFGMATVLGAWHEVRDAQGRVLTGAERYNALLATSAELMQQIREEANRTILETPELMELVQTGLGYAIGKGLTVQQAVKVISEIAQAGKLMGLQGPMLQQEVRAILGGGRLQSSQVALAFGINEQMLQQSGDRLFQTLMRVFASLNEATEQAAGRLDVQWSTLTSQIQDAMAQMGDGIRTGLAELLAGLNAALKQLSDTGLFKRIGAFLGILFQTLVGAVQMIWDGLRALWQAVSHGMSQLVNWIRSGISSVARLLGLGGLAQRIQGSPLGSVLGTVGELVSAPFRPLLDVLQFPQTLSSMWEYAGLLAERVPDAQRQQRYQLRPRAVPSAAHAAQAAKKAKADRAAAERARAERIRADIQAKRYEEAWAELLEMLDPDNAAALEPLMSMIEQDIAQLRAAEILAQIGKDTTAALRGALQEQARYERERTLRGFAERRAERLARARQARMAEQMRRQEALRERMRSFYAAVGLEEPLLQLDYERQVAELMELGVAPLWAMPMAAAQVYLPVLRRREQEQARLRSEFQERLVSAAERAREQQLRDLVRRFRAGLMTPEDYARALRRLSGAQPVPEEGLGALEAGIREAVEAGLPEPRVFELPEAFRARWLNALVSMKTYWGQFLQGLLHPEQYARVMELFDSLAVAFEKRFVDVASQRWRLFVQDLVQWLASSMRNAFVNLFEVVMSDFRRLGDGLRDFFGSIVAMIRRAIAELVYERAIKGWVERLMDWLQERLGAAGGVGGDGGGKRMTFWGVLGSLAIGAFTSWLGGVVGGWLGRIFRFQHGGVLMPYRVALVGEHGPELLVAGAGAYGGVYPASMLRQLAFPQVAPSSVSITVQVSDFSEVGLARRVATEVRRVLRERGV